MRGTTMIPVSGLTSTSAIAAVQLKAGEGPIVAPLYFPGAAGRFDRGVSSHQGHAARVAAEIDGRQIGIAGNDANIKRIDAQNFGDDVGENRIRTLANFRRSAKDAHAAAAIQLQLDAGVRQLVVVDWSLRAGHVSTARDSN